MNFVYEYRTSDNARHTGVVKAASRDAAFASLKQQGIRPSRLADAPGFANRLFGRGKRWIAIGVLCALLVAVLVALVGADRRADQATQEAQSTLSAFDGQTRRQILGDAAIIEKGIRTGWVDVFALPGDRFFASFAIPGVKAGIGSATVEEIEAALNARSEVTDADGIECRQIKAMVEGVKAEAREFRRAGGSLHAYGKKLVARQEAEIAIYNRAKAELETLSKSGMTGAELEELWERRNDELRTMGIRLIQMPEGR